MKNLLPAHAFTITGFLLLNGCTNNGETSPCTYPHRVTIDTACSSGNGVKLSALDFGDSPDGFEWTIIAVNDTNASLGWTPNDVKIDIFASSTFTVPDTLATRYKRLIVKVASICGGQTKQSIYYGFNKSTSSATSCTTWKPQTY